MVKYPQARHSYIRREIRGDGDNCDNSDNCVYSATGGYKHTAEPWHRHADTQY
jgi:hypothetical protein